MLLQELGEVSSLQGDDGQQQINILKECRSEYIVAYKDSFMTARSGLWVCSPNL